MNASRPLMSMSSHCRSASSDNRIPVAMKSSTIAWLRSPMNPWPGMAARTAESCWSLRIGVSVLMWLAGRGMPVMGLPVWCSAACQSQNDLQSA